MSRVPLAVLIVLLAAGCASGTKSGGTVTHEIRIVMQTPDAPEPDAEYFAAQVQKRSSGRIQVVEGSDYSSSNPDNEARLVRALRSGKVEMAYVPSRAWERASSVTSFRALQAPFLVTNYRLLRGITTGPIGRSMLGSLGRIGVVGLGLVPDELRRPLGRKPLDSPASFRRARIRVVTSPMSVLALRSLGAVPLTNFTAGEVGPALKGGRLDGLEGATNPILGNRYARDARYLTANLALFAKTQTIAIRKSVFARLSAADRANLRAAAAATVAHADPAAQERNEVPQLCRQGIELVQASGPDLASLRELARPVYGVLERDAATRKEIRAIERLRGPRSATSALPPCAGNGSGQSGSTGAGLAGTYAMTASLSKIATAAGNHSGGENWGSFRLVLRDGRFRMSDRRPGGELVQGASSGWSAGTYAIQGGRIVFTPTAGGGDVPLGTTGAAPVVCRWSRYRDALTFQQLPAKAQASARARGLDSDGPPALYIEPWRQVS